jgi:hypothetical protein
MDACNWLLDHGVDPDRIRWVKPRDAWLHDRASFQPRELVASTAESFSRGIEDLARAESLEDLWRRLEASGQLYRLDPKVMPTMYRGAILSTAERKALQQIERVVRRGRVRRLSADRIVMTDGEIPTDRRQVHVDCTAYGFRAAPVRPVFESGRITIQSLMGGFTTFNAALIGFIEATGRDDTGKNRLCPPTPQPGRPTDWIRAFAGALRTSTIQSAEPEVAAWLSRSRLNLMFGIDQHMDDPRVQSALARLTDYRATALKNAGQLLGRQAQDRSSAPAP